MMVVYSQRWRGDFRGRFSTSRIGKESSQETKTIRWVRMKEGESEWKKERRGCEIFKKKIELHRGKGEIICPVVATSFQNFNRRNHTQNDKNSWWFSTFFTERRDSYKKALYLTNSAELSTLIRPYITTSLQIGSVTSFNASFVSNFFLFIKKNHKMTRYTVTVLSKIGRRGPKRGRWTVSVALISDNISSSPFLFGVRQACQTGTHDH